MNVILLLSDDDNDDGAIKSLGMSYDFEANKSSYHYSKDKGVAGHQWEEVSRNEWFAMGEEHDFDLGDMDEEEEWFDREVEHLKELKVASLDNVIRKYWNHPNGEYRLTEIEPGTRLLEVEELTREALTCHQ